MLSFVLIEKYGRALAIAGLVLTVLAYHRNAVRIARNEGYANALKDVNAAAEKLNKQADEGTRSVEACFRKGEPWIWNRETGKCVRQ